MLKFILLLTRFSVSCLMKTHLGGTEDVATDLWMVSTTIALMGEMEAADPLAMREVGAVPTVVTGVEAPLINHCKMQVG